MPKRLTVQAHLSVEALGKRYREASEGTEKSRTQVVWLVARGKTSAEVADVTGYHPERVRQIVRTYNEQGPDSLPDQRPGNSGRKRLLTADEETALQAEIEADFAAEKPWTGVQVAIRMSELLGRQVHPSRGWEFLKRIEHRLKAPRRQHLKRDVAEGEAFKKR